MPNFLFLYRNENRDMKSFSPEQIQQIMQRWMDWINGGIEAGWMVNKGDALDSDGKVVNSDKVVTDGPFAESKEIVGGYSVVQADSLDAAAELAKSCPGCQDGGKVEVRPLAGL